MIEVHIVRDNQGFIREFSVKGHAGYSEHGSDIVCSAVSAVTQTAVASLQKLAGIKKYTKRNGYLKCSLPLDIEEDNKFKAGIILESMTIGLKQIERSCKKYVSVLDEEV